MFFLINSKSNNIILNTEKLTSIETMTGSDNLTVKFSFEADKFVKFTYPINDCINVDEIIHNIENSYQPVNGLSSFISLIDQQNVDNFSNNSNQELLSKNSKILIKLSSIHMVVDNNENGEVHLYTDDKTFVIGDSVLEVDYKIKEKLLNFQTEPTKKMSFSHRL